MATFLDNFTRADSGTIGNGWTRVSGTAGSISSNALLVSMATDTSVLLAQDTSQMASADHFAEVVITTWGDARNMQIGPCVRMASDNTAFYHARINMLEAEPGYQLFKFASGAFTLIGSSLFESETSVLPTFPVTLRLEANGSTIRFLENGVEFISVTNTDITTGTKVGIRGRASGALSTVILDDFSAQDLGAAAPTPPFTSVTIS